MIKILFKMKIFDLQEKMIDVLINVYYDYFVSIYIYILKFN